MGRYDGRGGIDEGGRSAGVCMNVAGMGARRFSAPAVAVPLISWPGGSPENTGIIIGVVLAAYVIALWLTAVIWTARDMRSRSHDPVSQLVAVLMVMALNLPGWVLYRVLRPPLTLAELYDRQLEEETLLRDLGEALACPTCSQPVEDDYVVCPHCTTGLKDACGECGKALSFVWRSCPWCGVTRERQPAVDDEEEELVGLGGLDEPVAPLAGLEVGRGDLPRRPLGSAPGPATEGGNSVLEGGASRVGRGAASRRAGSRRRGGRRVRCEARAASTRGRSRRASGATRRSRC